MHYLDFNETLGEKRRWEMQNNSMSFFFLANPVSSTLQNSSCSATYLPSLKPSKLDEQKMLGTAGEVRMNSYT